MSLSGADETVVIIGAGLMGAASAWALTRRGRPVVVLEQSAIGHRAGSSHGSARIVRRAYGDQLYTRLTGRAFELWATLDPSLLRMLVSLPPLLVTCEEVFHFPRLDPSSPPWPSVIHEDERAFYHLAGGRDGGAGDDRKLGVHDAGTPAVAGAASTWPI